jgi:hypothetical protein
MILLFKPIQNFKSFKVRPHIVYHEALKTLRLFFIEVIRDKIFTFSEFSEN